jgi:hypothetical protein
MAAAETKKKMPRPIASAGIGLCAWSRSMLVCQTTFLQTYLLPGFNFMTEYW